MRHAPTIRRRDSTALRTLRLRNAQLQAQLAERVGSEESLRQQNEYLAALYETTLGLINRLDVNSLLEAIVARATALLDTNHAYLYAVEPDGDSMVVRVGRGIFASWLGYRLRKGEGLGGYIWEVGLSLAIDDYSVWPSRKTDLDLLHIRALVGVPLRVGGDIVGVIGIACVEEGRVFSTTEIERLTRFGQLASLALENARLFTAAQQELEERRRTEAALRVSDAQNRALVNAIPDMMFRYDRDGIFLDYKAESDSDMFVPGMELLGKTLWDIMPEHLANQAHEAGIRALEGGGVQVFEYDLEFSGEQRHYEARVVDCGSQQRLAIVRDMTARKQAELVLDQARIDLEARVEQRTAELLLANQLLREQTETLATVNRLGRLLSAELDIHKLAQAMINAATELTGAQWGTFFYDTVQTAGGGTTYQAVAGISGAAALQWAPMVTSSQGRPHASIAPLRSHDIRNDARFDKAALPLTQRVASYLLVPVVSRSGQILGRLCCGHAEPNAFSERDEQVVSGLAAQTAIAMDNAHLYLEAQQAVAARDHFFSVAAHELKTPLTALLGFVQLLSDRLVSDAPVTPWAKRALDTVCDQGMRLDRLVDALLDLTRIQTGQLALEYERVDIIDLVRRIVAEMSHIVEQHTIVLEGTSESLIVDGDELRLEQVMHNLLHNAIKYSPRGGTLQVRVEREGTCVRIAVADPGIGIPADALPLVFNHLYRADNTSSIEVSGMGLGLHVAKEIVVLHGGTIDVESEVGCGTTFTVMLPLIDSAVIE